MVSLGIRNDVSGTSNMGRETHIMPVTWEPAIARWEEVRKGVWEPIEYMWPVVAPQTGKIERDNPLIFSDKPQVYSDAFEDNFNSEKLHLEWNFRRVPQPNTYSLKAKKGVLRLNLTSEVYALRGQYSLMGIRQKESDFEFSSQMNFSPKKNGEEAGISIFQQDDNYINFTISKSQNKPTLKITVKERNKDASILKETTLFKFKGDIIFKMVSTNEKYEYYYSLDEGANFLLFAETANNLVICKGYIGTNIGVYATSNGKSTAAYADYDWVKYQGQIRK
jgi:alpha-N-arabinofuranosidase